MKKLMLKAGLSAILFAPLWANQAYAADYKIDTEGAHAFVEFKIKHLGYSWLLGRFNSFEGDFSYDKKAPDDTKISVVIDTNSIDSNHAERDKHLRGKDFLDVKTFPTASFKSQSFTFNKDGVATVTGEFTLKGVTNTISFPVKEIGQGNDPWGGYRAGFEGKTQLKLTDYNIAYDLGPASSHVDIYLYIEGIKI